MRLRKEILIFYALILVSAGVIIAAEKPEKKVFNKNPAVKCCKLPKTQTPDQSTPSMYYITDGLFRLKA